MATTSNLFVRTKSTRCGHGGEFALLDEWASHAIIPKARQTVDRVDGSAQ